MTNKERLQSLLKIVDADIIGITPGPEYSSSEEDYGAILDSMLSVLSGGGRDIDLTI